MTIKIVNNSKDPDIYDKTIELHKNGLIMYVDISFDRQANLRVGCDSTQFENDLIDMLQFVASRPINVVTE